MQVKDKLFKTIQQLDEEAMLQLYNIALTYQRMGKCSCQTINLDNIYQSQELLAGIEGQLSSDIHSEREERC